MGSSSRNLYARIGEGQSTSRPPLFDGTNYSYWKEWMRIYIRSTNFQLWLVIKNGEEIPMKKVGETTLPKTENEFDADDIKKIENYAKAINMLYCTVNPDDYRKISCCTAAKEMWDKLEVTYEGSDQVREAKIDFLTQEYEMFRMKEGEKIDDMFDRFSKIINDLHALKKTYTNKDLVRKILRSLTPEWRSKADAIYESIGVSNVTIDGLRGNGEGQSTSRPPLFDGTNYTYWKERMRIYIRSTNFQLWLVIKNGEETPMKKVSEKLVPKTEDEFDAEDIKKVENYAKAINMLYYAVNPDDYRKISCCTTAKEMWDKLEVTYESTDQVREAKIDFLTQEYEMFRMKEGEKIDDMFDRFSKIINDLHALKKTYTNKDLKKGIALKVTKEIVEEDSSDDDNEFGLVIKKFHKFMKKEFVRKGRKHDGPPKCYGCGEIGHIKLRCPKGKSGKDKPGFKKQRAYISWGGDSVDESTDQEEEESANLCLMAHEDHADEMQEAYRVFNKRTLAIEESPHVVFSEDNPRLARKDICDDLADSLERIHVDDDEENTGIYTNTQPQTEEIPQATNQDDYDQSRPMYDNQPDPLVEEIIRLEQKIFYFDELLFAEGSWYEPPYSRDYTLFAEEQIEANKVAIRERAKLLESVRKEKEFERRLCEGLDMMQKMLDDFQRERLEAEAKADKLVNDLCKAIELKRSLQSQDQMREINAQKEALEPKTNPKPSNHQ
ncbi:unnamed protein product, partial [Cuscuta campestris]